MNVLITGASGLLGKALVYEGIGYFDVFNLFGTYNLISLKLENIGFYHMDIRDKSSIYAVFSSVYPDIVIHTAALTNVDLCHKNKYYAYDVNVIGTNNIVNVAREYGAKVVYISTDFVYSGYTGRYKESSIPQPINYYGFTKLLGEKKVLEDKYNLVVRTSIYGWNPFGSKKGIEGVIERIVKGDEIFAPIDQYNSVISTHYLSKVIYWLIQENAYGIYNIGSRSKVSKFAFFREIARLLHASQNRIKPIEYNEYLKTVVALRPRDVSLNCDKLLNDHNVRLPDYEQDLAEMFLLKSEYFKFWKGDSI